MFLEIAINFECEIKTKMKPSWTCIELSSASGVSLELTTGIEDWGGLKPQSQKLLHLHSLPPPQKKILTSEKVQEGMCLVNLFYIVISHKRKFLRHSVLDLR